jgi:hypothetical protein
MTSFTNIFVKENSWLDIKNWFKGIVLDNHNYDDFLKYDFESSVLSWSFAIEMQVRAEALKRTSWKYYLLDWGTGNKLYMNNWVLELNNLTTTWSLASVKTTWISTISLIKDWTKIEVKIDWDTIISKNMPLANSSYYNIWNFYSGPSNYFQWNDVIDYVKIYKKVPLPN